MASLGIKRSSKLGRLPKVLCRDLTKKKFLTRSLCCKRTLMLNSMEPYLWTKKDTLWCLSRLVTGTKISPISWSREGFMGMRPVGCKELFSSWKMRRWNTARTSIFSFVLAPIHGDMSAFRDGTSPESTQIDHTTKTVPASQVQQFSIWSRNLI